MGFQHHNDANGELTCGECGLHLGHRFRDGPAPSAGGTFLRDCINSACMTWQGDVDPPLDTARRSDLGPTEPVDLCCVRPDCPSDVTDDGVVANCNINANFFLNFLLKTQRWWRIPTEK